MARGISTATFARRAAAIGIAAAAATGLSACGAGQVTQTDTKQTAIAGVNVDTDDLALRDLQVEYSSWEGYAAGDDAPLRVWISNEGDEAVSLVGVSSPAAEAVTIVGSPEPVEDVTAEAPEDESTEEPADDAEATDEATEEATTEAPAEEEGPTGSTEIDIELAPTDFVRLDQSTGDYLLLEGLLENLPNGNSVEVVFEFDNGETVTVNLPVGQALEPAEREYEEHPGPGH